MGKLGFRYYAPSIGRFICRDPSDYAAGPNLYGFCGGDPVNFFDPTGCEGKLQDGAAWDAEARVVCEAFRRE